MSFLSIKSLNMSTLTSQITTATKTIFNEGKINVEITKLCRESRMKEAMGVFYFMNSKNIKVDRNTYISLVQICTENKALYEGKSVHTHMLSVGFQPDLYLSTKLVSMYVMCNSLVDARQLFDKMPMRNIFCWNAMLRGCIRNMFFEETISLYHQMLEDGIQPDRFTFPYVLKACCGMSDFEEGKKVHDLIISGGLESDVIVGSTLIDMYAKCGRLEDARQVFYKMPERDIVTWSAMIGGSVQNDDCEEALKLFRELVLSGTQLDPVTIVCVLPACARLGALQQGKQIHELILRSGFQSDIYVLNAIIDVYAKCGSIDDARYVFDKMSKRDVVSWGSIITGYSQNGHYYETLTLFREMRLAVVEPSLVTFAGVLSACAELGNVKLGKEIHGYVIKSGLQMDVFVGSALIDMYSKCGSLETARQVFDQMAHRDLVLWNSMIAGYVQNGHCNEALKLFNGIQQAGLKPNIVTLVSILPACAGISSLKQGKEIHCYIVKGGLETELIVGCALIDMYARGGVMNICQIVFDRMSSRDVVLWNSMICGYVQNSYSNDALKLFCRIQQSGIKPDSVTLSSILPACTHLANLQKGKEIHGYAIRNGFEAHVSIGNALIDMYAKCGTIKSGRYVFDSMGERDVVSWNAIIAGYGLHGYGVDAFHLFNEMQRTGIQPDYITFIALLSTCSRAGLVVKGWEIFKSMSRDYEIIPKMEHYACMVDLLGRSGQLDQARDFMQKLPLKPGADVYASLLGSCRVHCNVELAEFAAEQLFELEPDNAGYYVLLSNIYATAGRWVDVEKVRLLMKDRGVKKQPGFSWIEAGNGIHSFTVGDKAHQQFPKINETLERLIGPMKEAGYGPDTEFRHDVKGYGICSYKKS